MSGEEFKFFLREAGINYTQFAKNIYVSKSPETIRRWTEKKQVGEVYKRLISEIVGKKLFEKIEERWEKEQAKKVAEEEKQKLRQIR